MIESSLEFKTRSFWLDVFVEETLQTFFLNRSFQTLFGEMVVRGGFVKEYGQNFSAAETWFGEKVKFFDFARLLFADDIDGGN